MAGTSTSTAAIYDFAGLAPLDRGRTLLERFDALVPGETLVLKAERPAHDLLETLQRERKGQFEWTPGGGAAGPDGIEVMRRDTARGSGRGVLEALAWDHDRLDALDAAAFASFEAGDIAGARAIFAAFARGLERHIRFEEEILFPALEARAGFGPSAGPTAVMRTDHVEIRACLAGIAAALDGGGAGASEIRVRLATLLGGHNLKEEQILYPLADRVLGKAEADALVGLIQRLD
ncbi:MAG: hemerythrin domain-containing protein [Acidobacteriota bacterium]